MRFSVYQVSRKGGREKNEDRLGYCYTRDAGLFALADGMCGHPEGEVASQLALQTMAAMFQRDCKPSLPDPVRFLQDSILAGHHQLLRYATQKSLIDTPRTTIVACLLQGRSVYWAHCGDSRLYMVRGVNLLARTRDHSYSEMQEFFNQATASHPQKINRNVLFTCLGSPVRPVVDVVGPLPLQGGDRLMLCSDGLWSNLSDLFITEQLARKLISEAVPDLVEQALREGGAQCDNVSVLAVEWEASDEAENGGVSTRSLGEEVFASTIQASMLGQGARNELDEAEIDRSIKEINEAIRRSSGQKKA